MEKIFGNKVIRTPKKTPPEPGSRDSFTDEPPKPVGPSFAHSLYERSLAADWVPTRQYAEESSQESFDSTLDYDPAEECAPVNVSPMKHCHTHSITADDVQVCCQMYFHDIT
ncbi:Protein CBG14755 [Caenorhabditis briggsae]|uniref:Protein CBG14755 n=1 Tax=Caenorhabditis briggsae TaxID=6238 RepID=A8XKL6_CAEBR|nr:Protein CBG14755 [Caenorhabditis briggsae]CAP33190.2 Protein CBG14755 [Caenorhabditis briggsae]